MPSSGILKPIFLGCLTVKFSKKGLRMLLNACFKFGLIVAAASIVGGCAAPVPAPAPATPDPVAQRLDGSIASQRVLAPQGPEVPVRKPVYTAASTTVSYFGDASVLLAEVAQSQGWQFQVTGPVPRLPIFVQVDEANVPLAVFLSRLATQLSQRADIAIESGVVELRYRPPQK